MGKERILKAPCCAMFAASRDAIKGRGKDVWWGLREWLVDTTLDSGSAGRILEWTWHVWFGMDAVLCPSVTCECDLYGIGEMCGSRDDGGMQQQQHVLGERDRKVKAKRKVPHYMKLSRAKGRNALGNQ